MGAIGFLFPGQGSQKVGMGKDFYNALLPVRHNFEAAEKATGLKLMKLCFYGPQADLDKTAASQIAMFLVDFAAMEALKFKRLLPQAVFGVGPGLYAALVSGGALDFATALTLLTRRTEIMVEAESQGRGLMVQISGLAEAAVEGLLAQSRDQGPLDISFYLGEQDFMLSGEKKAVVKFLTLAKDQGVKAVPLTFGAGFHSPLLADGRDRMLELLKPIKIEPLHAQTICPATGNYFYGAAEVKECLAGEYAQPVRVRTAVETMKRDGCFTMVEAGAGTVMGQWVRKIDRGIRALNVEDAKTLSTAAKLAN